jgi:hypothetical protein
MLQSLGARLGRRATMPLAEVNAEIGLPWGLGKVGGTWRPDEGERLAAWEMLVELSTRVSMADLRPGEGLLREALASLHALFDITRDILRRHGPSVAKSSSAHGRVSFGFLAIAVLNGGIRPLLAYWHPTLLDHEQTRPSGVTAIEWERSWSRVADLRADLAKVRELLTTYAGIMADVCDARPLLVAVDFRVPEPPGSGARSADDSPDSLTQY